MGRGTNTLNKDREGPREGRKPEEGMREKGGGGGGREGGRERVQGSHQIIQIGLPTAL